jgi:hypothetical protein
VDARIAVKTAAQMVFVIAVRVPFFAREVIPPDSTYGKTKHLKSLRERLLIALAYVL